LNGKPVKATVEARQHLATSWRQALHLTGTHIGCEHGVCGLQYHDRRPLGARFA